MYRISQHTCNLSKVKMYCLAAAECDNYSPLASYLIKIGSVIDVATFDDEKKATTEFDSKYSKGVAELQNAGCRVTAYALEAMENKKVKEILKTCSFKNALKI